VLNGYDIVAKEIYNRYRNIGWSIRSLIHWQLLGIWVKCNIFVPKTAYCKLHLCIRTGI